MALGQNPPDPAQIARSRAELAERLRERRAEIEEAALTRAHSLGQKSDSQDPTYRQGLRAAVAAAVDYGLEVIESSEESAPAPPPLLLAQARLAARFNVGLDTVLRRYSAGYALLVDFMLEEADRVGIQGASLKRLMRTQAALDRVLEAVSEEYAAERGRRSATRVELLARRIERLLAGEAIDSSALAYDLEQSHIGAIARGEGAWEALREAAAALDRRLLAIRREEGEIWAWLGGRQRIDPEQLERHLAANWPKSATLALGEPGEGLADWRLTHRQAEAAMAIALRSPEPHVRYAEVALLAAVLKDEVLATSLREMYLAPLEAERDGGGTLRETLRAYFEAGCNVSSAAAVLGVSRQAVAKRLRAVERLLGRSLRTCAVELETALRVDRFDCEPPGAQ